MARIRLQAYIQEESPVLGVFIGLQQDEVVDRISGECSNLVGIKDSSGNPWAMAENIRLFGERISVLSGAADMTMPTLALGGKEAILTVTNFIPKICVGF